MRKAINTSIVLAATFLVSSCGGGDKNQIDSSSTGGGGGGGTTPTDPPPVTTESPLSLRVFTKFDGHDTQQKFMFAETGTETCIASDNDPEVTCTVTIPEGRLYYSSLYFSFSWLATKCKLLYFQPYYYRASTSATYLPPGAKTTVDCTKTGTELPSACFGGAATSIMNDFPQNIGLVYIPDEADLTTSLSAQTEIKSGYSLKTFSNRLTVNDLPSAKRATPYTSAQLNGGAAGAPGDGYVAGALPFEGYADYTWTCDDDWSDSEPYIIHLNVRDEDTKVGNTIVNDWKTWTLAP